MNPIHSYILDRKINHQKKKKPKKTTMAEVGLFPKKNPMHLSIVTSILHSHISEESPR